MNKLLSSVWSAALGVGIVATSVLGCAEAPGSVDREGEVGAAQSAVKFGFTVDKEQSVGDVAVAACKADPIKDRWYFDHIVEKIKRENNLGDRVNGGTQLQIDCSLP